jgi:DNA-binding NarL/FixJ family response regulator
MGEIALTLSAGAADRTLVEPREPVTIVIGRFEDLIGLGLRSLIAEDANIELLAADVELDAFDATLGEHEPTVAIINFGSLRTPVEVNRLHNAHPGTRLLVLANRPTPSECNQMLAFGATACLSKETEARDILNAIHLASRGLHVLPRTTSDFAPEPLGPELLTPREADVLEHLQAGRSNAEIALALSVSVETVRTHRRNIYRKLGVRTRRELASLTQA